MLFMKMPNKAKPNQAKLSIKPSVNFFSINEPKTKEYLALPFLGCSGLVKILPLVLAQF